MNRSIVFVFEKNFDREGSLVWIRTYWTLCFVYATIYLLLVYLGQRWMHQRRAFQLSGVLAVWNWSLAAFSLTGTVRFGTEILDEWINFGFEHTVCSVGRARDNPVMAFWSWYFVMSKVVELGDTAFTILRKRRLVFLHWYHHTSVLLYTWYSAPQLIPTARWFILMNYSVHAVMYSYYAFRAMKFTIPRMITMAITSAQLLQMLGGLYANWRAYRANIRGQQCDTGLWNIIISLLMYASYCILFGRFFYNSYVRNQPRRKIT